MNREIKFRSFIHQQNRMVMVNGLCYERNGVGVECFKIGKNNIDSKEDQEFFYKDRECVLMQYTGLKDKKGTEIYEGDIVRILYSDWISKGVDDPRSIDQYKNDIASIKVVVYDFNGFYLQNYVGGYSETIKYGPHGFIEIIGNVFEHPNLLGNIK